MISRILVAFAAVAVLGWLVVMERDERLQERGVATSNPADLEAARLWNPDTTPDLRLAFVALGRGRRAEAQAVLEDLVRREPDNIFAWGALLNVTRGVEPAVARTALMQLRRLDPLGAPPR